MVYKQSGKLLAIDVQLQTQLISGDTAGESLFGVSGLALV